MRIILPIADHLFIAPGRDRVPAGHILWPSAYPAPLNTLALGQDYRTTAEVKDQDRLLYRGVALMKRRVDRGEEILVLLLPDHDLGQLTPNATVELHFDLP
ncbi:MAG: hypothetical protein Q4G49_07340 [Paracoccus sp. (in: a-proteobacteria)]|nr:hypothetical protein [Paracoccus sp. (in: a-proteobacteria)]